MFTSVSICLWDRSARVWWSFFLGAFQENIEQKNDMTFCCSFCWYLVYQMDKNIAYEIFIHFFPGERCEWLNVRIRSTYHLKFSWAQYPAAVRHINWCSGSVWWFALITSGNFRLLAAILINIYFESMASVGSVLSVPGRTLFRCYWHIFHKICVTRKAKRNQMQINITLSMWRLS